MSSCDFCGAPIGEGKRTYRAASQISLITPEVQWVDQGDWTACAECACLIEDKQWKALMDRAARLNPGLRAARDLGKLRECAEFVAETWSAIFDQPKKVFFGEAA